ncbi:hypothetical protein [Hafnia paralvei]|uniref:hypothetical protein n=1 Tax=Hafnia paralvei TaxID=546367 RepID=UPI001D10B096|nr:hypothetical protein [Hafnia paralvei]
MASRTLEAEKTITGTLDRVEFVGVPVGHHTQPDNFNLEQFEYRVTQPDIEQAARMLLLLMTEVDNHYGQWGPRFSVYASQSELSALHTNCRGGNHAFFPPGLYSQRQWLRATDESAPLAGADFCCQQLR